MLEKLALLLKSKVAIAAVGAILVAGAGVTAVNATTGGHFGYSLGAHGQATATGSARDGDQTGQVSGALASATATETSGDDTNETSEADDNESNEQELTGTVQSVDTTQSSFVLRIASGASETVGVSSGTEFGNGIHSLADLTTGMQIETTVTKQSDSSLVATSVQAIASSDGSGDTAGGQDEGSGSGSSGADSSASSGSGTSGDGGH